MFGNGGSQPAMWSFALIDPAGLWLHSPANWGAPQKVPTPLIQQNEFVTMRIEIEGGTVTTYLNDEKISTSFVSSGNLSGPLGLRFDLNESGKLIISVSERKYHLGG